MRRGNAAEAQRSLAGVMRTLERLAYVPRRVAVIAAPKITDELRSQFDRGEDPYGRQWAPLKPSTIRTGRKPPPLTDSTRLRSRTMAKPYASNRAGIRITIGARYGKFHQVGFRVGRTKVKPRPILPARGLPLAWKRILDQSARQAAKEAAR